MAREYEGWEMKYFSVYIMTVSKQESTYQKSNSTWDTQHEIITFIITYEGVIILTKEKESMEAMTMTERCECVEGPG